MFSSSKGINLFRSGFCTKLWEKHNLNITKKLLHNCNNSSQTRLKTFNSFNRLHYNLYKYCSSPRNLNSHLSTSTATNFNHHDESESKSDSTTVKEATKLCMERFKAEDIPEAELHAAYIVAHVIGVDRNDLSFNESSLLTSNEMEQLNGMMECRLARMPLQYIIGNWDFHDITIKLCPPVFIPRMETEQLVDLALEELKSKIHDKDNGPTHNVLDICCGSGAIALAILKNNTKVNMFALDKSEYAINLTTINANDLGLSERLTLVQSEITNTNFPSELCEKKFDLILCNPPYVPRKDTLGLQKEILLYEDIQAIDGGDEGLEIIKPIVRHCQHYLSTNGVILMEIDPCQPSLIPKWLSSEDIDLEQTNVYKDLNGHDRFIKFTKKDMS